MMGTSATRRLRSVLLFFALTLVTLLTVPIIPITASSPAYASENVCSVPQNSCGCPTCGCGSGGGGYGRPSCPVGFTSYEDYCLPSCPDGFRRYPGIPGLCVPPCYHGCPEGYDQVPLPECPQGFHRNLRDPNFCDQDRGQQQFGDNCPYGMAYSSETGQCEVDCPAGSYLGANGLCQSYYAQECPKDFTRDAETGKCLPPGVWPQGYAWVCLPHCPTGYYRDIQQPTRCIPPPPTCPEGYDNVQGRCLPVCGKNVERDAYGYCVPKRCPEDNYQDLRGNCIPVGCQQGFESYNRQCVPICKIGLKRDDNGRCVPPPPPPTKDCPQGQRINVQSGDCERIPNNEPKCSSAQTYSSKDKRCLPRYVPPPDCKIGLHRNANNDCVPDQPPTQQLPACKKGSHLDDNGRCVPNFFLVPRSCPEGTEFNRRTKRCVIIDYGQDGSDVPADVPSDPPQRTGRTLPKFDPNVLQKLIPKSGINRGDKFAPNVQVDCPDGEFRDENGRCVPQ